jgi:AAA+ superfamily predicted ATPase
MQENYLEKKSTLAEYNEDLSSMLKTIISDMSDNHDFLINEVDEKDPRYKENKEINISKANLGQIGQMIDAVFHPYREDPVTLDKIYCSFLKCKSDDISRDKKVYPPYRTNLVLYALDKILSGDSPYIKQELDLKVENNYVTLGKNDSDFHRIKISSTKEVRIPSYFHIGIQRSGGRFVLKTEIGWNGSITLHLIYKKGDEEFIDGFIEYLNNWIHKNNFYKGSKITPAGEFIDVKDYSWDDVFLKDETKDQIVMNVISFFKKEEIYKKNGISAKCGLIWEGPPGTGKTLTAKILANQLKDITFIWITPDDLHSSQSVSEIYMMARELSPTIVFFEDADLFCMDRGISRSNAILGEIMNQLDGLVQLEGVVTIFTSNDPGVMEKALVDRPGRFDERIVFGPPPKNIIISMLKKFMQKPKYDASDLDEVANRAEKIKLTGAHIKRLSDLAIIYAINEDSINSDGIAKVEAVHFFKALDKLKDMRIKAHIEKSGSKKSYLSDYEGIAEPANPKVKYDEKFEPVNESSKINLQKVLKENIEKKKKASFLLETIENNLSGQQKNNDFIVRKK